MKVKSESEVAQSCPTLSDPMDYSPPGPLSMGFSRQEYWSGVPLVEKKGSLVQNLLFGGGTKKSIKQNVSRGIGVQKVKGVTFSSPA